ncbi:MAG: hypothetical protein GEU77_05615 [Deltaproteobacteria bacterium]|nr:hypothetical protein [Deltaproteobacteria bacterium]
MQGYAGHQDRESPENLIGRVAHRLRNHALWDSLLIFSPPLLAILFLIAFFYSIAWIPAAGVLLLVIAVTGMGLLAVVLRFRPLVPTLSSAARLVDDKVGAKDRFVTLATLSTKPSSEVLVHRLRREAAGLLSRVEIRRDFPYRIKRSFLWSVTGSVFSVVLFYLLLISSEFTAPTLSPQQQIRDLAEQMAQRQPLAEIARALQSLATKLEDTQVSPQEQQSIIQEMQKQIAQQQKSQEQQDNRDLLSDVSSTLKSLEQEAGSQNPQEQQEGGGAASNASEKRQGEGKQSQGNGGDSKGEITAQVNKEMGEGKSSQENLQGPGQEKNPRAQNEANGNQPDPGTPEKANSQESGGKTQGSSENKSAKNRSEEVPKDGPPAERYYQPGEQGNQGIKGAGYVTVQLPEELAADSNGAATASKDGKETKNRPKLPVSNIPLPAHVPDAAAEKQRMPLEYRGIIR